MTKRSAAASIALLLVMSRAPSDSSTAPIPSLPPGTYASAIRLSFASPVAETTLAFRIAVGDDPFPSRYLMLDREISLSAARGEERSYRIEVQTRSLDRVIAVSTFEYAVDRRPPPAPALSPEDGPVRSGTSFDARIADGAECLVAVSSGAATTAFSALGEVDRVLRSPRDSVGEVSLFAYATDARGNRSAVSRRDYLVYPDVIPVPPKSTTGTEARPVAALAVKTDIVATERGASAVFSGFSGDVAFIAITRSEDAPGPECYAPCAVSLGRVSIEIPLPYGASGTFWAHVASDERGIRAAPPARIDAVNSEGDARSGLPLPPRMTQSLGGDVVVIEWPAIEDGAVMLFSVNNGPERAYEGAFAFPVPAGVTEVAVTYRTVNASAVESARARAIFVPERSFPAIPLIGARDGDEVNRAVTISPPPGSTIRYEVSRNGEVPKEPGPESPILSQPMVFDGSDGTVTRFFIRYRAYANVEPGAKCSSERILGFVVDKEAPSPPVTKDFSAETYSEKDRTLDFVRSGDAIWVRIVRDGKTDAAFVKFEGPISLAGAEDARVSYVIDAFAMDAAGNRSLSMKTVALIIDKGSVYVAGDARSPGSGTPDAPFRDLEGALRFAVANGKKAVYVRGNVGLSSAVKLEKSAVTIYGSCDNNWNQVSGPISVLSIPASLAFPFALDGAALSFSRISVAFAPGSGGVFLTAENSGVRFVNCSLTGSSRRDVTIVDSRGGTVDFEECVISLSGALFSRGVIAEGTHVRARATRFATSGASGNLTMISARDGSIGIEDSLFESSASVNAVMVDSERAETRIARSSFTLAGGTGYGRVFRATGAPLRLDNVLANVAWKGEFSISELDGADMRAYRCTFLVDAKSASMAIVKKSRMTIANSILVAWSPAAAAIVSDAPLTPLSVLASDVYGFDAVARWPGASLSIADCNAINQAADPVLAAYPNFSETPSATFESPTKGGFSLKDGSKCLVAGLPDGYFAGTPFLDTERSPIGSGGS